MDRLQEGVSAAAKEGTEQNMREVAGTLELLYSNTRHALYNINYHLKNQKNLDMFAGPKDAPRKLHEDIDGNLKRLVTDAKKLGIEGIAKRKYE